MANNNLWGIILAAGEGRRVQPLLVALCGGKGIKQFCAVTGRRSMLQHTLARVERLIPRERILMIVGSHHRAEAVCQLADYPENNIIYQPLNRETAPGILLPLAHISQRYPNATVAVFPSDHFVLKEALFMKYAEKAVREAERRPEEMVLLGMTPDRAEEGYGWIEPGRREEEGESFSVSAFQEKPPPDQARRLLKSGALWNTLVFACRARALWDIVQEAAPDLHRKFYDIRLMLNSNHASMFIQHAYHAIRSVNFSSDICSAATARLRVLPVPEVGWSDWGNGEQIFASLAKLGKLQECIRRIDRQRVNPALRQFLEPYLPKPPPVFPEIRQSGGRISAIRK